MCGIWGAVIVYDAEQFHIQSTQGGEELQCTDSSLCRLQSIAGGSAARTIKDTSLLGLHVHF